MRAPPGMHDTTGGVVDEKPALAFNCSASPPSAIAPFERAPATVAIPLTADIRLRCNICRNGPIVLQKSLKPERRFSRLKPTQAKVATKSDSGPITEVTDELSARSCDPPHPYTKNAPTAQKFSDQRCKRTFAKVSSQERTLDRSRGISFNSCVAT